MAARRSCNIMVIARLLRLLRDRGPCSRARLAKLSSLSSSNIERYLDDVLVPLGMVEARERPGRKRKEYVITPLGVMVSVLLGAVCEFFDPGKHGLRREIVEGVETVLRARGFRVDSLLSTRTSCSLASPADLSITSNSSGRSVLLYIATSGDEALVKAVMGLGLAAMNGGGVEVVVATPEKPCMGLGGRGIHIVYYDPGSVEGAVREIARSIELLLGDGDGQRAVVAEASSHSTRMYRI